MFLHISLYSNLLNISVCDFKIMHHIAIVKIHNGEINAQFGAMSD